MIAAAAVREREPAASFAIPPGAEADAPPERRGLPRDGVRLLAARPAGLSHHRFADLADLLDPGDLLVVNTSATLPAALDAVRRDGRRAPVHVATALDDGDWVVEVRRAGGDGPARTPHAASACACRTAAGCAWSSPTPTPRRAGRGSGGHGPGPALTSAGTSAATAARSPTATSRGASRSPITRPSTPTPPAAPRWRAPGAPFTAPLLVRLMARGVTVAPVVLHAGVSSPGRAEPPLPERFAVPEDTAAWSRAPDRPAGGWSRSAPRSPARSRAPRAPDGEVRAASGWTGLVLGPERPARVVTGLVTGLHEPEASHLLLLEAVAGPDLVGAAYDEAVAAGYLWHEFGDSMLFLPRRLRTGP